jgi:hypothetical protein
VTNEPPSPGKQQRAEDEFRQLAEHSQPSVVRELWDFLRENKAWWLTPIVIVLLLISVLVILGASGAAPLIYTLF